MVKLLTFLIPRRDLTPLFTLGSGSDNLLSGLLKNDVTFTLLALVVTGTFFIGSISLYWMWFENFTDLVLGRASLSFTLSGCSSALIVQDILRIFLVVVIVTILLESGGLFNIPSYLRASLTIGITWSSLVSDLVPRRENTGLAAGLVVAVLVWTTLEASLLPRRENTVTFDAPEKLKF